MAHPGNHGSFGPSLDGNAFGTGDGATADRSGVIRDGSCQPSGEVGVVGVESQKRHDRTKEVLDVLGLRLFTPASVGLLPLGVALCGPLRYRFGSNPFDGGRQCPDAS